MKRYLRVYLYLFKLNLSVLLMYRGGFISSVVSSTAWGVFSFISMFLLTNRTGTVLSWTATELMLMTATYTVFTGIFHIFFSHNFNRFAQIIYYGDLDALLVKPIDVQFSISLWLFSISHFFRVIIGIFVSIYILSLLHIGISVSSFLSYILILFISLVVLYSIWLFALTVTIWYPKLTNLVDVMYTVSGMGRYPREVYSQTSVYLGFLLLPLVLTTNAPTLSLLKRPVGFELSILTFCALLFFILSRKFFLFALRHYSSTGS